MRNDGFSAQDVVKGGFVGVVVVEGEEDVVDCGHFALHERQGHYEPLGAGYQVMFQYRQIFLLGEFHGGFVLFGGETGAFRKEQ